MHRISRKGFFILHWVFCGDTLCYLKMVCPGMKHGVGVCWLFFTALAKAERCYW